MKKEKCIEETKEHITKVMELLNIICLNLIGRAISHDKSKLEEPELDTFVVYTSKLKNCTYGSKEYKQYLKEMQPALEYHYKYNRHHPEHFVKGCQEMTLIDLLEMLCDWKAATLRHKDGDIYRSIEQNQKRFNYSDELKDIFKNTINYLEKR